MSRVTYRAVWLVALATLTAGLPLPSSAQEAEEGPAMPALAPALQDRVALSDRLAAVTADARLSPQERALRAAALVLDARRATATDASALASIDAGLADLALVRATLAEDPLGALDAALASRAGLAAEGRLGANAALFLAQAGRSADAAAAVMAAAPAASPHPSSFAERAALARASLVAQAGALGIALEDAPASAPSGSPSEAAFTLLARHAVQPDAEQRAAILALDTLSSAPRAALLRLLDAFVAYEEAARSAYAGVDLERLLLDLSAPLAPPDLLLRGVADPREGANDEALLAPMQAAPVVDVAAALDRAGIRLGPLLGARLSLLDAAVAASAALSPVPLEPVHAPPALILDLDGGDDAHEDSVAFLLDLGGNDAYRNNAGGSNVAGPCDATKPGSAAALLDLSGNDSYVARACGMNGGGFLGSGFLLDAGGKDAYGVVPSLAPAPLPVAVAVGAASEPSRIQPDAGRLVVGHGNAGEHPPGDTYLGAPVVSSDPALGMLVVSAEDPVAFRLAAKADPDVRYVEEDVVLKSHAMQPDDARFTEQYGLAHVNATGAWALGTGGPAKKLCVVDSGIDPAHEDLLQNYVGGYDFVRETSEPFDEYGHGTHVTGIAAATLANQIGIAGMAQVGVLSAKVLDHTGVGWGSEAARAIRWCADNGGDVISVSLGGGASSAMQAAGAYAWGKGKLLVASAGNAPCSPPAIVVAVPPRGPNCVGYPANYPEFMAVSCTDDQGYLCSFSSYGTKVEIAAPGNAILSTLLPCASAKPPHCDASGYGNLSGTSMSAPHVSGTAVLVWSLVPDLTNAQLRQLLRNEASRHNPTGCDMLLGYGIVDAGSTLAAALAGERPAYSGPSTCNRPRIQQPARGEGVNGGASFAGLGFLFDADGPDAYTAGDRGVNGGGYAEGIGLLVDGGGDDVYAGGQQGVNGGGNMGSGTLLDASGNDRYEAAGVGTNGGGAIGYYEMRYGTTPYGHAQMTDGVPTGTGSLVDLGGDDAYLTHMGHMGANGGGSLGVGFLLDAAGNDAYDANEGGVNGGSLTGVGMLVDAQGDDTYDAWGAGANGGAWFGAGFLVDGGGADAYRTMVLGINGGAVGPAAGHLVDLGTANDAYEACADGGNGAARGGGAGFLVDAGGDDAYRAPASCEAPWNLNGAGFTPGSVTYLPPGFLFDAGGNDSYRGGLESNGGGSGTSILIDASGNDRYEGGDGSNGAASGPRATSLLVDVLGDDEYLGKARANGGGSTLGEGLLFDGAGNDRYVATHGGANGGGWGGYGFLGDGGGDDEYEAGDVATNGGGASFTIVGADFPAIGFLRDHGTGTDAYRAGGVATNGGASHSLALLLDDGGLDTYQDDDAGAGTDRTKSPKGSGGTQLDLPPRDWPQEVKLPGAPLAQASSLQPRRADVAWKAPLDDGASPIMSYRVYRGASPDALTLVAELDDQARRFSDEGAPPNARAWYGVSAVNPQGEGPLAIATARTPRCADIGPDPSGMTCAEVPYSWLDASAAPALVFPESLSALDLSSEVRVDLPFPHAWYGATHESVNVRSNGILCFGVCYRARGFEPVPDQAAAPVAGLLSGALACDWIEPLSGKVKAATFGEAPQRTFVVAWDVPRVGSAGPGGFRVQAQLHEGVPGATCMIQQANFLQSRNVPPAILAQGPPGSGGVTYLAGHFTMAGVGVRFAPVPNAPPVAAGSAASTLTDGSSPVSFADASTDAEGALARWTWDFGDGTTSTSDIDGAASHSFAIRGAYVVRLTVTDDAGQTNTTEVATVTMDRPPELSPTSTRYFAVGLAQSVPIGAEDRDGDPLTYAATGLPDGATLDAATGNLSWTPREDQVGTHPAFRVVVSDGILDASQLVTLVVRRLVADAGGDRIVDVKIPARFTASASASTHPIVSRTWDFGDGTPKVQGASVYHAYAATGIYTATLNITDAAGLWGESSIQVTVTPRHGLQIDFLESGRLDVAPGATVSVPARIRATGESSDTVAVRMGAPLAGWQQAVEPSIVVLEPGGFADVLVTLRAPATAASAQEIHAVVQATSENREVTARRVLHVRVPYAMELSVDGAPELGEDVKVLVRVAWADGSPAANVPLRATSRWLPDIAGFRLPSPPPTEAVMGTTDAEGIARITLRGDVPLTGVFAPGRHEALVVAQDGRRYAGARASFDVTV